MSELTAGIFSYQDGSEQVLLDFFSKQPSLDQIESFYLKNYDCWPLRYHLDPARETILNWFPFKPSSHLLEIGAGCGALTRLFSEKCAQVTALEPDPQRHQVLKARTAKFSDNICFLQKTIQEFIKEKSQQNQFDYITLIGVLEYFKQDNITLSTLLKHLNCFLKKTGTLIIAIENKLALKYFAGEPEDHTGLSFDSLNDYPRSPQVQTFSDQELITLLTSANFSQIDFYYPFPDYKLPQTITHQSSSLPCQLFDFTHLSLEAQQSFSGSATAHQLQKNNLISHFVPSFLVFART